MESKFYNVIIGVIKIMRSLGVEHIHLPTKQAFCAPELYSFSARELGIGPEGYLMGYTCDGGDPRWQLYPRLSPGDSSVRMSSTERHHFHAVQHRTPPTRNFIVIVIILITIFIHFDRWPHLTLNVLCKRCSDFVAGTWGMCGTLMSNLTLLVNL